MYCGALLPPYSFEDLTSVREITHKFLFYRYETVANGGGKGAPTMGLLTEHGEVKQEDRSKEH